MLEVKAREVEKGQRIARVHPSTLGVHYVEVIGVEPKGRMVALRLEDGTRLTMRGTARIEVQT